MIEKSENAAPLLKMLASQAGISIYHSHRAFKRITGLTPKQYWIALRERKVRDELGHGSAVTNVIFDAGYNSSSRFYEKSDKISGMKPSTYRAGGIGVKIHFAAGECSLGSILVVQSERGICAISLGDDPDKLVRDLQDSFPHAHLTEGGEAFEQLIAQVISFIETPNMGLNLPLDVQGTAFQQRVWLALREILAGQTIRPIASAPLSQCVQV